MNRLPFAIAVVVLLGGLYLCYLVVQSTELSTVARAPVARSAAPPPTVLVPDVSAPVPPAPASAPASPPAVKKTREEELTEHREIDKAHMRAIYAGLFAYKAKHGHFPEHLSQLIPDYITPETLTTPRAGDAVARQFLDGDHPDPKVKPAYGFEFSNLVFRDGRTFAEIKEVQRTEWGDVVPLLRAFGYDGKVLNMSYSGDFYETRLNWEWDAATLDVVDKIGWGVGLNVGETVKVQVIGPDGQPASNARVWANGRNYSFDLPERPFATDAEGYVTIPIGSDVDRTALALRAEAPGLAAQAIRLEPGTTTRQTLTMAPATIVSGIALNAQGRPAAGRRVILKTPGDIDTNQTLAQVITGPDGRWTASLHSKQAQSFNAFIARPGGPAVRYETGTPVNPTAAARGTAVIRER